MNSQTSLDDCVKYGRQTLWVLLCMFILIAAALPAVKLLGVPAASPSIVGALIAVAIVALVSVLHTKRRQLGPEASELLRAMFSDELRKRSLDRSFRIAFIGVLAMQAPLCICALVAFPGGPAFFMAYMTAAIGPIFLLASFLYMDR
ncbi:hypothetical protein IHE49_04905 [Rhodanobacter sp. 7MK24]|uniref:hypothetical protein n=1 Tax=Rhodanobacter sp. 7MK24 TaxID=2775922 RepID=UPI001786909D|nr:hypothetical protein [Rhodanobacter sp. 7MK24]MBD8879811.1 hypothetical protein [Rhodanobacter sp. 7MK24]